ncbi:YqjF family protein [Halegenticoccus soli]|uniref:YqjF family protein n=1 Tax=Halegenticoccus soli TaxID=1985678 RepID=UPI000C6DB8E6|nr:DUF2071 domain-containing protein [Halegenticoccus soli]
MLDRPLLSVTWRDNLFAHWRVDPERVRQRLPAGLDAATHDGSAWLSVVALVMADLRPYGLPASVGRSFAQVNLRTYVEPRAGGERGLYFFSLDASDPIGVPAARALLSLPYRRAKTRAVRRGQTVRFESRRTRSDPPPARFAAAYRPTGEAFEADADPDEAFLAENYASYVDRGDRLYRFSVRHDPWRLRPVELDVRANTLFEASGFEPPSDEPIAHYGTRRSVDAGWFARVD